ncbi:pentapeptide repeat-containing protein [Rhodococcus sp. H29-C3]|uniref:pentapeptide repeat-containing protein n=1 Tax=Rhodococcus sp. H29-C3 TaxID=3046307 RepID=UPI0024B9A6A7|nr:pentapeptide repeat-containing protein [Rhodococcus sp. H29-C3]MDJ0362156.1 pentapeptide repeat-containing protein [Rhodococcus sp. H29-C3]
MTSTTRAHRLDLLHFDVAAWNAARALGNPGSVSLVDADLSGATLISAYLGKANLTGAKIVTAILDGADLTGAIMPDGTSIG